MSAQNNTKTYAFDYPGTDTAYDGFRPRWNTEFARRTLAQAGIHFDIHRHVWVGTENGKAPVVASIGSGTGSDAAVFKALGCEVILVEPNDKFMEKAKANLGKIARGIASFIKGDACNTGIASGSVDIIVGAQAFHTFKDQFNASPLNAEQRQQGEAAAEERSRQEIDRILSPAAKQRASVAIWYYNPDPNLPLTQELHDILVANSDKYAQSKTPLLNAAFFEPTHFQPWADKQDIKFTELIGVQEVSLKRDDIKAWMSSYSFAPQGEALDTLVDTLQTQWFDRHQSNGVLKIPYVGFIAQAPLRPDAFPAANIGKDIGLRSPLHHIVEERPVSRLRSIWNALPSFRPQRT